jgi:hypothetical protein
VVSADVRFQGSNGAVGRAGSTQRIRYRKFGINWRVSDTAKAKSAKSTSPLYLGPNYDPNKAAVVFIFTRWKLLLFVGLQEGKNTAYS